MRDLVAASACVRRSYAAFACFNVLFGGVAVCASLVSAECMRGGFFDTKPSHFQ